MRKIIKFGIVVLLLLVTILFASAQPFEFEEINGVLVFLSENFDTGQSDLIRSNNFSGENLTADNFILSNGTIITGGAGGGGGDNITIESNISIVTIENSTGETNVARGADGTNVLQLDILSVVSDIWKTVDGSVQLADPTGVSEVFLDVILFNVTGNGSFEEVTIRNGSSLCFVDGCRYRISAADLVLPNPAGIRRQIRVDGDFQVNYNFSDGMTAISAANPSDSPGAKSTSGVFNNALVGIEFVKSSSSFVHPALGNQFNLGQILNVGGALEIIHGPLQPPFPDVFAGDFKLGFHKGVNVDENNSFNSAINKSFFLSANANMSLNLSANVTVVGPLNITQDLDVEGTITGNNIYGGAFFFEPNNGNLSLTTVGEFVNIDNFGSDFRNEMGFIQETYLTIQEAGIYHVECGGSFASQSGLYAFAIGVNDIEQNRTIGQKQITSVKIDDFGCGGDLNLSVGDNVSLMGADLDLPAKNIVVINARFHADRLETGD